MTPTYRAMLHIFAAALRRLDAESLAELRQRCIDLGERWPAVPAIDREIERRGRGRRTGRQTSGDDGSRVQSEK